MLGADSAGQVLRRLRRLEQLEGQEAVHGHDGDHGDPLTADEQHALLDGQATKAAPVPARHVVLALHGHNGVQVRKWSRKGRVAKHKHEAADAGRTTPASSVNISISLLKQSWYLAQ